MKGKKEFYFYISVGAGLAFGTSSFMLLDGLFGVVPGVWVCLGIILAGLVCMVIAGSIAELASRYPSSPGIRTYLKVALGDKISLFLVHSYLIFIVLIAGAESYVFAQVFKAVFPETSLYLVVLVVLAIIILVNLMGMELPKWFQMLTTYLLIAIIIVLGIVGIINKPAGSTHTFQFDTGKDMHNLINLPAAIALGIFLYIGFEWVTPLGFRPASYRKKIPNSMLIAILLNMIAYVCFSLGMPFQLNELNLTQPPQNDIPQIGYFMSLFGKGGGYFALILSFFAAFSTFNAGIMGASKLVFILGRERCIPSWSTKISEKTGVLKGAIWALGILSIISALFVVRFQLGLIFAVIGSSIICFIYSAFILALILLKRKIKDPPNTFRSKVPILLRWFIVIVLPAMGIQALVSQPERTLEPIIGMGIVLVVAFFMTKWSLRSQGAFAQQAALKKSNK
jgi:ethanolamine permease